jgi:hypothetical protein
MLSICLSSMTFCLLELGTDPIQILARKQVNRRSDCLKSAHSLTGHPIDGMPEYFLGILSYPATTLNLLNMDAYFFFSKSGILSCIKASVTNFRSPRDEDVSKDH